jgi:iron(III) transport system substrate-binding protein
MRKLRRRGVPLVALAAVMMLAGCGGSDGAQEVKIASPGSADYLATLEAAANEEGTLTVYASAGESQIQAITDTFKKDYPNIDVSYLRLPGGPLLNRYASEAQSGSVAADVFMPAVQPDFIEKHPDWFVKVTDEMIPSAKGWPSKFRTDLQIHIAIENVVLTYNKNLVKTPPTSWEDVLDPKWTGKAMITDPRSSPGYMSWFYIMQQKFGDDFLKRLAALKDPLVDSGAVGAQKVAAGAYAMSFPSYPSHTIALEESGAPIGVLKDLNPTQGLTTSVAISAKAPHPNAARLFANWLVGPKGHNVLCGGVYSAVGKGAAECDPVATNYTPAVYDISAADQAKILSLLGLK